MLTGHEDILKSFVDPKGQIPSEDWSLFSSIWSAKEFKRKEIISPDEETEKYLYFILEGAQRVYYSKNDKEATLIFTYPHSFGGNLDSFLLQVASNYTYEALTKSLVLRAHYSDIQTLRAQNPIFNAYFNSSTHFALAGLLQRMVELQCYSSTEKFQSLLERSPHILNHIPHKYLANYMGMDATNFSKLINSVKI